jgi:hypothetical protein
MFLNILTNIFLINMVNKLKNSKTKISKKSKLDKSKKIKLKSHTKSMSNKKKIMTVKKKSHSKKVSRKPKLNTVIEKKFPDCNDPTEVKKYLERTSSDHHLKRCNSNCFLKSIFSKTGFYKFAWFPFLILLFVLILNFVFEFILYTNVALMQIQIAKNALLFSVLISTLFIINLACYFYMGSIGSAKNYRFKRILPLVLKLILTLFLVEVVLGLISYFTFIQPYLLLVFKDSVLKQSYILYSVFVVLVKSMFYLLTFCMSYILYSLTKFRKL